MASKARAMSKIVFKYVLNQPLNFVAMDMSANLLHVSEQSGEICLWACVDKSNEKKERVFRIVATGEVFPDENLFYVGTAHLKDGVQNLVFHVFERLSNE
jgi:hypothetical protein